MQTEYILILVAAALVVVGLVFLLRRKSADGHSLDAADTTPALAPEPDAVPQEGHGLTDEFAAAAEDVVDQLLQIDSHHDNAEGPTDELTRLKGLGPKAAARLQELGVHRYAQIAAWNDDDVARFDAQLGAFKGRITRDRWVDQARFLAEGDTAGFEATFGKLGG